MARLPASSVGSQPPSGRQLELTRGAQRAVVVEVGGGLREYELAGKALLDGYAKHERCRSGRGQILLPWPNRLRDGCYEWEGERQQLPLSEAARSNAIHGLLRWANWTVAERSATHVVMSQVLHPQDGYPFALDLRVAYSLDAQGLTVQTTATNVGAKPCPYGAGAHPYLTVGAETIDECLLHAPASTRLLTDERAIPIGSERVEGSEYDFRAPRTIGATQLDTAYTDLQRDPDGRARVTLAAPGGGGETSASGTSVSAPGGGGERLAAGRSMTLWVDEQHPYLMLFTGDTLPETRRRRSLAVEPMTCAPNAFQSGDGLRTLDPGESFTSRWGIECGPA